MQTVIEIAAADPLLAFLALLVTGVVTSHLLFRRDSLGRAIVRIAFLILLTFVLLHADIVPYQPLQPTGAPLRDIVPAVLKIAWWLWAAWFLVGVLHAFVMVERSPNEGRLVQDLLAGAVYLAALFAIVGYVFDLSIQGILATSGVIAIILGLALQSTLGDVFSGIVLNFSRPYRPGDWVTIDGGTEGRVIETNWRSTHILTGRLDLAIVPNSSIAKAKIVNVSSPSGVHGLAITVEIDSSTPPSACIDVLERATLNCRTIVATPAPAIAVKAIRRAATEYEITFFVSELAASMHAQNELLDLVHRHLTAAGIDFAPPPDGAPPAPVRTQADRVLALVDVFRPLTGAERSTLAAKLRPHFHERGGAVVASDIVLQSLFIIASGVASVARGGGETELIRLGPGDHFGEIGMMTGHPSRVTIKALTDVILYELTRGELEPILAARPELSRALSHTVAERQIVTAESDPVEPERSMHQSRLRALIRYVQRRYGIAVA